MNDIEKVIDRVTRNNNKAMRKVPPKSKQVCETCRHAGKDCGRTSGQCACGMWWQK